MRKVLFIDTFAPWTSWHEKCLKSFLGEEKEFEVFFGILDSNREDLSPKDKEAILKLVWKSGKTLFLPKEEAAIQNFLKDYTEFEILGEKAVLNRLGLTPVKDFDGLGKAQEQFRLGQDLQAPYPVLEYVADHPLFFAGKISLMLQPDRYRHSVSVAKTAYEIAKANRLDAIKAYQAGIFHDIAKDLDKLLQRRLVKENMPEFQDYPSFAMHQFAGEILARNAFGIEDEEVLSAIGLHCTGKAGMSLFEQVVYCADKCEPLRDFETGHIYQAALMDAHSGFLLTLKDQAEYLSRRKIDYHTNPLSSEMYDTYLKEVYGK